MLKTHTALRGSTVCVPLSKVSESLVLTVAAVEGWPEQIERHYSNHWTVCKYLHAQPLPGLNLVACLEKEGIHFEGIQLLHCPGDIKT